MNEHIKKQLDAVLSEVAELERLIKPYEKLINKISAAPFNEMSISEKVAVAKLLTETLRPS